MPTTFVRIVAHWVESGTEYRDDCLSCGDVFG